MIYTAKIVRLKINSVWNIPFEDVVKISLRRVEFYLENNLIEINEESAEYLETGYVFQAFKTSLDITGNLYYDSWWANAYSASLPYIQADFHTPITFDKIIINNGHSCGGDTQFGVKDIEILISPNKVDNLVKIWDGQIPKHCNIDMRDNFLIPLSTTIIDTKNIYIAGTLHTFFLIGAEKKSIIPITKNINITTGTCTFPPLSFITPAYISTTCPEPFMILKLSDMNFSVEIKILDSISETVLTLTKCNIVLKQADISTINFSISHQSSITADIADKLGEDISVYLCDLSDFANKILLAHFNIEKITNNETVLDVNSSLYGTLLKKFSNQKTLSIANVFYEKVTEGKRSFKAPINPFLRPGDVVNYNETSLIVNIIKYTLTTKQSIMEVIE